MGEATAVREPLTREAILAMTAGREMDALIGERVYGWRREKAPKDYDGEHGGTDVLVPHGESLASLEWALPRKGSIALYYFCRSWSTEIEDAWPLLAHCRGRYGYAAPMWDAQVAPVIVQCSTTADVALCIARAALAATLHPTSEFSSDSSRDTEGAGA